MVGIRSAWLVFSAALLPTASFWTESFWPPGKPRSSTTRCCLIRGSIFISTIWIFAGAQEQKDCVSVHGPSVLPTKAVGHLAHRPGWKNTTRTCKNGDLSVVRRNKWSLSNGSLPQKSRTFATFAVNRILRGGRKLHASG